MKHLKLFETETQYESFKSGSDFVLPNVSLIEENERVVYNPFIEQKSCIIRAKFSPNADCMLAIVDLSNVKSLKIDGEEVRFGLTNYEIWSEGEHNAEIELIDPTLINGVEYDDESGDIMRNAMFYDAEMESETCLTSIIIPDSVKNIGNRAFANTTNLTEITCEAIIAPTIWMSTFDRISKTGVLKYPAGSDYSSWLNALGSGWTGVEI